MITENHVQIFKKIKSVKSKTMRRRRVICAGKKIEV